MDLVIDNVTATSIRATYADPEPGQSIDIQFSIFPTWENCVCPIIRNQPLAQTTFQRFNADTTYYAQARVVDNGVEGPWSPTAAFRTLPAADRNTSPVAITHAPALIVTPTPVLEWNSNSALAGYPAANLGFDAPVAWRSFANEQHFIGMRVAPEPIDTIALLMSNLPEASSCHVGAGATFDAARLSAQSAAVANVNFRASPNLPARPGYHGLIRLDEPQAHPFWAIYINAECPGGVLHMEHLVMGRARVSKNVAVGDTDAVLDLGTIERNRFATPHRTFGARMRKVEFDLGALDEAQHETLYRELGWRVGLTDPVLVVPNSKSGSYLHDRILYGTLVSNQSTNIRGPLYNRSLAIESLT